MWGQVFRPVRLSGRGTKPNNRSRMLRQKMNTHRIGNLDLLLLSDGTYYQDAGAVFGVVPRIMWERLNIPLNDRYQMPLGLNSLLVRSQGKTVLIETGVGDKER